MMISNSVLDFYRLDKIVACYCELYGNVSIG